MAGNLSHSECTCENPNLCMLAFVCITFQGSQFNYQGEVTVLWVQRPFVHTELHHFLTFFASVVTKLQESAISSLSPPSGALFFFSCYSGITSGIFRNINLLSFQKNIYGSMPKKHSTNPADALCEDTLQSLNEVTTLKPITSHCFSHHHDFLTS